MRQVRIWRPDVDIIAGRERYEVSLRTADGESVSVATFDFATAGEGEMVTVSPRLPEEAIVAVLLDRLQARKAADPAAWTREDELAFVALSCAGFWLTGR